MKLITVFRKNDGSALSGLVPKITINNITDINVPFLEIDKDSMIDIGSGFYSYIFSGYKNGQEYTVYIDADSAIPSRYQYGTLDKFNLGDLEAGFDFGQMMRVMFAVLAGQSSGGGGDLLKFKAQNLTKDRINATVDANGNRLHVDVDGL